MNMSENEDQVLLKYVVTGEHFGCGRQFWDEKSEDEHEFGPN